jgi:hypothetical protein
MDKLWRILVAYAEESRKRTHPRTQSKEVRKGAEGIGRRGCVIEAA